MAVNLSPVFGVAGQLFDNNGNPLAGGKIFTYLAGTTTPAATYTSSSGAIAHSNPIVLDGAGRVPSGEIWLTDGISYKFVVEDAANNLIGTYDNLTGINSNFVAFTNEQEIQTATAGQTVFNLATATYQPGTNSLSVFVDGVNQYGPGAQYAYVETDSNTVTFVSGLHVGASVKFTTSQLNSSGSVDASQVSYNPPFINSVVTNVEDKLGQIISVKDFGAVGDGSTDDAIAITNADSEAQSLGKALYFPSGTYISSIQIQMTASAWFGDSSETSIIKLETGASVNSLVQVGPAAGTGTKTFCSIQNIGFDGNNGCSDSVVKLRNVQNSLFTLLNVTGGVGNGFSTNTSTASINTQILRNSYSNIMSYENDGIGFLFVGEKDSRFDNLFSRNNGSDGFKFQAFKDNANQLAETTTCTITALLSRDNTGNGFVFDMVEKYVAGSLESSINGGAGFQFESTLTGAASYGSNSLVCASMLSRNDAEGAFRMSNTAYVYGLKIGSLIAYGFNSTLNYPGIIIYGGTSISFGSVLVQGFKATAVYLQEGTPFGGPVFQSNNIHFDLLKLTGNGDSSASNNSGLAILNNSYQITVNNLISSNSETNAVTGEYELTVSATSGPIYIGCADLTADQSGYEQNIGLSETYITTYKRRSDKAVISLLDNGTNPTVNLTNHAQLYIDSSDGDLKIRFSNGTIKTIATN